MWADVAGKSQWIAVIMHVENLAEKFGGRGNFVWTRAKVPRHVRAQFIVREDNQIQLQ